jgi:hypothetical protein
MDSQQEYKGTSKYVLQALSKAQTGERLTSNEAGRLGRLGFTRDHFSGIHTPPLSLGSSRDPSYAALSGGLQQGRDSITLPDVDIPTSGVSQAEFNAMLLVAIAGGVFGRVNSVNICGVGTYDLMVY